MNEPLPLDPRRRIAAAAGRVSTSLDRLTAAHACILCLAVRLAFLLTPLGRSSRGNSNYWSFSEIFLNGAWSRRSTFLEPLYPLFLAAARWATGDRFLLVMTVQILTAVLGCWGLYRLSTLWCGERRIALLASLIYAFYPYAVRQSAAIIYLPLLTTLLIFALWAYQGVPKRGAALGFGVFSGLACLTRAEFLPVFMLLLAVLLRRRLFSQALTAAAALALLTAPFAAANYVRDGSLSPTRSGFILLKGNCRYSDQLLPEHSLDLLNGYIQGLLLKERPDLSGASNRLKDRFFFRQALEYMGENPLRTLKLKALNVFYLYSPRLVPYFLVGEDTRVEFSGSRVHVRNAARRNLMLEVIHFAAAAGLLACAAVGLLLRRGLPGNWLPLTVIAYFTATYALFFPSTRLRAGFEFLLMFYAGAALQRLLQIAQASSRQRPLTR